MAVWEQAEESFSEALLRSVARFVGMVCLVTLVVGPVVAGGWMASAYIVYRTNSDELQLPALEKKIPSPTELIQSSANTRSAKH
ncbi:hypothetical protein [Nisaea sediminum]|uniref:hypothetical protein n=1 Tax=Nisaea sediminum TaxID=2775867 RepID=UPI0018675E2F|nr:hypothetical protein [Nisaea sediminum]